MQENQLFEYAVIRFVPKVEREEFINLGIILYCAKQKYLKCSYSIDAQRIASFSTHVDLEDLKLHLAAMHHICLGDNLGGPIAMLDLPSRFRWLTAARSTILQTSRVHPGFTADPQKTLERLYNCIVL